MNKYKSKLLVKINNGEYIDIFHSIENKVSISFKAIQDSQDHHLRIVDKEGNYVEFKCILVETETPTNTNEEPANLLQSPSAGNPRMAFTEIT
jgi:hypothetical protein